MPVCLLILIGLPGSGKTTLARRIRSSLGGSHRVVHVEYDAVVDLSEQARLQSAAAAGEGSDAWREVRKELESAVEAVVTGSGTPELLSIVDDPVAIEMEGEVEVTTGSQRPTVFIIDDNLYLRSMRYRYFQLARRHQLGFAAVLLDVPVAECLHRNSMRGRPVPAAAIEAMAARLERPDPERLWESRSLTLTGAQSSGGTFVGLSESAAGEPGTAKSSDGQSEGAEEEKEGVQDDPHGANPQPPVDDPVSAVLELISSALACPVAPLVDNTLETEASRRVCSTNQLHQLDNHLRRLVGQHAAGCGVRARAANMARQRLMRRVRAAEVGLDVEPSDEVSFAEAARGLFEAELAGQG